MGEKEAADKNEFMLDIYHPLSPPQKVSRCTQTTPDTPGHLVMTSPGATRWAGSSVCSLLTWPGGQVMK